ncbi:MAG: hypothetical protein LBU00_06925 [Treponema sp.]|nr:hypothetical protein [Treponema sp.]
MKKVLIVMAALALILVPLSVGAQTATEFQVLSFDIGYAPGWDLDRNTHVTPTLFGFNIRVADRLSAGLQMLKEGAAINDNFLLLKYSFLPQARGTLGFGVRGTTQLCSFGLEMVPFSRPAGGTAVTELKVAVKYDAPFAELAKGTVYFALSAGIGF